MEIKELIQKMTLHQKIGQLTQYNARVFLNDDSVITGPDKKLKLTDEDLATVGSVLNSFSADDMKKIQNQHLAGDPLKIPIIFMLDVIHGYRTIYPIPLGMACSFEAEIVEQCARMAAAEAAASGVQVTFAPMVDYVKDARWGRVMESGGEEPLLTGYMAAAQIRGFHGDDLIGDSNIATCVKHFAAYGAAEAGRDYNMAECSERELRQFYLPAFKAAIDAGAEMVMPAFEALNGVPATINPFLHNVLRREWGFDKVVISDYNAIGELLKHGVTADEKDAALQAFSSECDMEMCSASYFHCLEELVSEGAVPEEQIDRAVERVLRLKEKLGLFEDPYHGSDGKKAEALYLCEKHRELAKRAATKAAVLLKNDGVLPFDENIGSVALIGPFADEHAIKGFWSCAGRDEETVTVRQGVEALLGKNKVRFARGCGYTWNDEDRSGFEEAVRIAKSADAVILCLGEPQNYSGEGNCRTDIGLPGVQEELARLVAEANPNTAAIIFNGRPLALTGLDRHISAILDMWFPGTEGGNAAAELLFGRAVPSGKLAMSFPRSSGQCPIYYNHTGTARPHWTTEAESRGYASDYIDCGNLPLYSFGHGLSYTEFEYEEMTLSADSLAEGGELTVNIRIKNAGKFAADEVVQLYMRDPVASVVRPVQQLVAFKKTGLAPGEEKTVSFTLTPETFAFYDTAGRLTHEKGKIILMTGSPDHYYYKEEIELL